MTEFSFIKATSLVYGMIGKTFQKHVQSPAAMELFFGQSGEGQLSGHITEKESNALNPTLNRRFVTFSLVQVIMLSCSTYIAMQIGQSKKVKIII